MQRPPLARSSTKLRRRAKSSRRRPVAVSKICKLILIMEIVIMAPPTSRRDAANDAVKTAKKTADQVADQASS